MEALFLDNDILELEGIEEVRSQEWINYNHDEKGVPRVSHILAQCENQEGLIQWAANIGRRKYDYYREKALNIGTIVHENIDEYLMSKYVYHTPFSIDFNNIEDDYRKSVYNSFENFKLWEKRLEEYGCKIEEVVGLEIKVTCLWYGGTIDGIVKINGRYYIIDFKTSKKISMSYFLQASAYMWIVNNGYAPGLPHIDGIGIIRVDKSSYGTISDLFLNSFIPEQNDIIIAHQNCFMSYVNTFYRNKSTEYIFDNYQRIYNPKNTY